MDSPSIDRRLGFIPRELRFAVFMASAGSPLVRAQLKTYAALDWDRVMGYLRCHRLVRPAFAALSTHPGHDLPDDVRVLFQTLCRTQAAAALRNSRRVIQLSALLKDAGIPALFYKGVTLSQLLYNDPCARHAGDIDLLIPKNYLAKAQGVLTDGGFRRTEPSPRMPERLFARYVSTHSNLTFLSKDKAMIELHWQIDGADVDLDFDELWRFRSEAMFFGEKINTLHPGHLLRVLLAHGAVHAWQRLFWLKDIADLLDRVPRKTLDRTAPPNCLPALAASEASLLSRVLLGRALSLPVTPGKRLGLSVYIIGALFRCRQKSRKILLTDLHRMLTMDARACGRYALRRVVRRIYKRRMALAPESEFLTALVKRSDRNKPANGS